MILGEITFYTPERMSELWGFIRTLLTFVSPGVMLAIAIIAVGMVLGIVIKAWRDAAAPKDRDDEEDIEIHRY